MNAHFEVLILVFIFVFSTLALAFFKNDEMARWIEGGAIITVIARSMGSNRNAPPNTTTTTSSTTAPVSIVAPDPNVLDPNAKDKP